MRRFLLTLLLLSGCGSAAPIVDESSVALEQVPAAARKAARKALPEVKFDLAWKVGDGYELQGKTAKGKVHIVQVSPQGEVLEVE
ncbi:MAG: hypothetical protein U0836_24255 [Pirellulales bacterium]